MNRHTLLAAGTTGLVIAEALATDGRNAITPQELAKRQAQAAGPTRSERQVVKRQAVQELHQVSRDQIVLAHIHPRWLRREVAEMLDAGQTVTAWDIDALRKAGPR